MKQFTHLHLHSHYSLLTALPKIKEIVKTAKDDNMTALALTDNGNFYGAIEFYEECLKNEIKPILGIDGYMAARTRHDKEPRIDNRRTRIILLSKNYSGYQNLIKIITLSHTEGFYYKPRLDRELLEQYKENLIYISPFFNSEISNALKMEDYEKAKKLVSYYKELFSDGEDFYLEVVHHPEIEGSLELKEKIVNLAKETGTKIVASHDVYYMKPEDREARDTLVSIQSSFGSRDASENSKEEDFSFIDQKTANEYFKDLPEALDNITEITDKCNLEIQLGKWKFPNYIIQSGLSPDDELRRLTEQGILNRKLEKNEELIKRIDYELEVIKTKGYSNYFLAVADMLNYAKNNNILSNTRGSAAGSLVSYLIGITTVNPIALNLPFERFLNPERPSAPDIDMDFADNQRDKMIEYVRDKYGRDHVAQIGTFGTMLARGSVRDVARALNFDYQIGDKIAKLIPMGAQGFPMTIDRAMKETPELKEMYEAEQDVKTIIDMAKKIEGCARHIGVHAAGVVISPDPLTNDVPLQFDPKGESKLITQYHMHAVGEDGVGLLKFDFLGLKNLTIMGLTVKLAKKVLGADINVDEIPLDDKKTYEMLSRGETTATFQLNGAGMTRFLKELKPTNIHDINAMVALYRPGPMEFIPDYIERKHDNSKATYIDDRFKEILGPTFGILIYQDDIMMIAVQIAGYSWGEADKFRKAMGKKIPEVMREQKEKFTKGCMEIGGLTKDQTQALWDSIETFAAYGFNKAHAASYGQVAYLTSYLKANYPVLYMTAVLTAEQGDIEKVSEMITECKKMKIDVLPPDINESFEDFTAVKNEATGELNQIRFGLTTIKNFGEGIAHEIIEERKNHGEFESIEDFVSRIHSRSFNKKSLEALIKAGALDNLGERGSLLDNLENLLTLNKDVQNSSKNQDSLFGGMADSDLPKIKLSTDNPASTEEKLKWEKELLGLFVSGHPLDQFKDKFKNEEYNILNLKKNFVPPKEGEVEQKPKRRGERPVGNVLIAGMIDIIRVIKTKKNDDMAFVKVSDLSDSIEVVFFPEKYQNYKKLLFESNCIVMKGSLSARNGEVSFLVDKVKNIKD